MYVRAVALFKVDSSTFRMTKLSLMLCYIEHTEVSCCQLRLVFATSAPASFNFSLYTLTMSISSFSRFTKKLAHANSALEL